MEKQDFKKRVYIEDLHKHLGQEVIIAGWLYNKRSSGKIHFLLVRDGTNIIQCVAAKGEVPEVVFTLYEKLAFESSMLIKGKVTEDKRSPLGFELQVSDLLVLQVPPEEYPITKKEHGIEFLMDHRHLWLRSRKQFAVLRIRHEIVSAIRDFFNERNFILIDTPIFTPAACEGTSTLFETEYFGSNAYLTQSGQLYAEAAALAFGKVYCFGPTFRAEKSKTRRHLTEFWMVEPEVAFFDLDDDMKLAEDFISYIVQRVLERREMELEILERDVSKLVNVKPPFPKISYTEAVKILHDKGTQDNSPQFEWGNDFGGTDETVISEQFDRPVIVHRYPSAVKAFYMKRDPQDERVALAMDVLAPEGYGEIIGGSQREDDYDALLKRIEEHKLPRQAFEWYLDLRRYGSVPHAGFGLGIERTVAWICGIPHIRETIPFPRTIYRLTP
ncbi:MAG: asparagine--tRNA ligase [Caldithrix sp. RBG_13_44_9]|nr:MAG: asparagine--tRNA ligase [Caldithrix sp. RBG_13_44_9]